MLEEWKSSLLMIEYYIYDTFCKVIIGGLPNPKPNRKS